MEAKFLQQKIMRDFLGDPRIAELLLEGRRETVSGILTQYLLVKNQKDADAQITRLAICMKVNSPESVSYLFEKFTEWVQAQSSPQ